MNYDTNRKNIQHKSISIHRKNYLYFLQDLYELQDPYTQSNVVGFVYAPNLFLLLSKKSVPEECTTKKHSENADTSTPMIFA